MLVLEIKQVAGNEAPIPHCVVRAGAGLGRVMREVAPGRLGATLALHPNGGGRDSISDGGPVRHCLQIEQQPAGGCGQ